RQSARWPSLTRFVSLLSSLRVVDSWIPRGRAPSELETTLARAFGQSLDAAVVEVAVAVEDDLRDALGLELRSHRLADELGGVALLLIVRLRLHFLGERRAVGERLAGDVVDDLRVD